jgi:hypothetical protein
MIKRRLEKLELKIPPSPANLLDRLQCRAMATLTPVERLLVQEANSESRRKRTLLPGHHAAIEQYSRALTDLMQEISDEGLIRLIAEVERRTGLSVSAVDPAMV